MMLKSKVKARRSLIGELFLFSLCFSSLMTYDHLPYAKSMTVSFSPITDQLFTCPSVSIILLSLLNGYIHPVSSNIVESGVCRQLDSCACRLTNGSGIINLQGVAFYNGNPRFVISESEDISLAYNPCVPFTLKPDVSFLGLLKKKKENKKDTDDVIENYCTNAAVCKFPTTGKSLHYQNLGQPDSAKFDFDEKENNLLIRYTSPDISFITTVYLICNKIDQLSIKEERNNSLKLNLQTICACPDGCHSVMNTFSPGTYIVIVFTSVMLSYLILGILYKKIVHSAEGKELIPNRESWTSFFSLVKDGYLFFISPCLGNTVEYRYYQNRRKRMGL